MSEGTAFKKPIKILVVDDMPMICTLISQVLSSLGYEVDTAQNGQEAYEKYIASKDFDLIISDMDMPVLNGMGLLRRLRKEKFNVAFMILTGNSEASLALEAIYAGADDYLFKDENIEDMIIIHTQKVLDKQGYISEVKKLNGLLKKQNEFITETFGRYISDEVVESLLESPKGLDLGGEEKEVTVMMTDLRGFTGISEQLPAKDVVRLMNGYLEIMTEIILKHHGTINEILGDAIVVLFGAPLHRDDDAERAVACAIEMQIAMNEVNEKNAKEGLPEIEMGIGLNTGTVIAGNIGSSKRVKYSVIGSPVNLAARVESYSVGGQVLVSEHTYKLVEGLVVGNNFLVSFKGVEKPVEVYEVKGLNGNFNISLPEEKSVINYNSQDVEVEFVVLEQKVSSGDRIKGLIIGSSKKFAVIETKAELGKLLNLKLFITNKAFGNAELGLYGKIMKQEGDNKYLLRYTFVPDEITKFLSNISS